MAYQSEEQTRIPVGANDVFDMPIVQSNVRSAIEAFSRELFS